MMFGDTTVVGKMFEIWRALCRERLRRKAEVWDEYRSLKSAKRVPLHRLQYMFL